MSCKGRCTKYLAHGRGNTTRDGKRSYYGPNSEYKRCSICCAFLIWSGKNCPCCSYSLRTKPRSPQRKWELVVYPILNMPVYMITKRK